MICELCGSEVPFLKPLLIEGSILKVCSLCAKFGKEMAEPSPSAPASGSRTETSSQGRGGAGYSAGSVTKEEIIKRRLEFRERRMTTKDVYEQAGEKELVEDYHKRIQQGRDKLGWNQEQLGQKINERKSVISKLESRSMKPDDKLVRKLEKALGIKLMEVIE
jgi:putative transcription factor